MSKRNIIVIGGSMGSFEVFKTLAAGLPVDLDAAIFVVWHMSPIISGVLPWVMNKAGTLQAFEPEDGDAIEMGRIYVARPDHHLLVERDRVRVTRGPKENRFRPAVDPLFRSAAYAYGRRVIGVITSGALDDGTSGLWEVKNRGGLALAQDPHDAEAPSMPQNAMAEVEVDHVVTADKIADCLVELSQQEVDEDGGYMNEGAHDEQIREEIKIAAEDSAFQQGVFQRGELTPYTCPECSGVLARLRDGDRIRFRCHTGHAYSADALLAALTENIEDSLWSAVRGIDESIMLLNHLGDHFAGVNNSPVAAQFFKKAQEAQARNDRVRKIILEHELLTPDGIQQEARAASDRSDAG